jgi:hypothetical protein
VCIAEKVLYLRYVIFDGWLMREHPVIVPVNPARITMRLPAWIESQVSILNIEIETARTNF